VELPAAYWEPEWEMVPLPSIENRLANRDAYDEDAVQ
jgi:hypothetical protein